MLKHAEGTNCNWPKSSFCFSCNKKVEAHTDPRGTHRCPNCKKVLWEEMAIEQRRRAQQK